MPPDDSIVFACPHCGGRIRVPASAEGKAARCPRPACGRVAPVPLSIGDEAPAEPPPRITVRSAGRSNDDRAGSRAGGPEGEPVGRRNPPAGGGRSGPRRRPPEGRADEPLPEPVPVLRTAVAVAGAVVVVLGTCLPAVSVVMNGRVIGSMSYLSSSGGNGYLVIALAVGSVVLALFRKHVFLWGTAALTAGLVGVHYAAEAKLGDLRIAAWFVLVLGIGTLLASAAWPLLQEREG